MVRQALARVPAPVDYTAVWRAELGVMRAGVLSVGRWAGVLEQGGNPPAVMKVIGTKVPHGAWDPQRRG